MALIDALGLRLLVPLLFVVALALVVIRRGVQMKRLVNDGIETTGTVVRKLSFTHQIGRGVRRIRYQYEDRSGRTYSHKSVVTEDVYRGCEVGDPLPIVYSRSKPQISAPKYVVDQSRAALEKRPAGTSPERRR